MASSPIIFTVCSINQLANAIVLGDSVKTHHPGYDFQIGLVDKESNIPSFIQCPYPICEVNSLNISGFEGMSERYTHEEIVADCKPFFATYFLQKTEKLIFIDCTTVVFQSISLVADILNQSNIVITPQLLFANAHPDEKQILNSGIYHSGFIGLKKSEETNKFLEWWGNNTRQKGFKDMCKGLNADQLWLEHVPAMFDGVHILKEAGVNIGYWNTPERNINQLKSNEKLYSINYRDRAFPSDYREKLNNYSHKKLSKITPAYGFVDPNRPTIGKTIAKKIRSVNKLVDVILDKFVS
ncbi:MAG: hypothetical protein ACOVO2_08790 [Emticicia sp.]|uniref:hypothetical protein n=1 Tax=Emticicia sp. TaxID=1930953 RepID=UPI003BA4BBE4